MSESLATKYRPTKFEDVCSQSAIIKILKQQLATNQFKHSYIFSGASGCGKTTCARIFANEINKHKGSPIEIDAASNSGVDNVRDIIKSAQERSLDSEYKVYIIDEAHGLSNSAWQAFLKCIEEPPEFTIFIFCTTDPQKIPQTIINRCMRFNFNRINQDVIRSRLEYICNNENITNYSDSIDYISKIADGGMRNAISLLEKVADYDKNLSIETTLDALGNYSYDVFFNLINSIVDDNEQNIFTIISDYYNCGNDMKLFVEQFLSFVLDIAKFSIFKNISITKFPSNVADKLNYCVNFDNSTKYFSYYVDKLLELKQMIKNDVSIKTTIEIVLIQMARLH